MSGPQMCAYYCCASSNLKEVSILTQSFTEPNQVTDWVYIIVTVTPAQAESQ